MKTENVLIPNEEDIKSKILIPYLMSLGIKTSELSFEKNFTIKLGKGTHSLKGDAVHGRLDILCHKNNQNLFIVEAKSSNIKINQKDIDQGISYARLLDQIAPFVIVTNGETTKIFDSITKDELSDTNISESSEFWKNGCILGSERDLKIRSEALLHFISYNDENLSIFAKEQVKLRMSTLVDEDHPLEAKYNKSLFVERINVIDEFKYFINSDMSFFAILGESGVGKTNSICHLCETKYLNTTHFFYNASLSSYNITEQIANDFNMFFSSIINSNVILKDINNIAKRLNKVFIFFIDAIDESSNKTLREELNEIALNTRNLSNIKFCISCKIDIWANFIYTNGEKNYLFSSIYCQNSRNIESKPYSSKIELFNDKEHKEAIALYFSKFNITGELQSLFREDLKLGLFLHIFCQVFENQKLPPHFKTEKLIHRYLHYKLNKIELYPKEELLEILSTLGKLLIERENSNSNKSITLKELKNKLNLRFNDPIPIELFTHNILLKQESDTASLINFYYSKIRDYIIINYSYSLKDLSDSHFKNNLEIFFNGNIGISCISSYYLTAPLNHKQILDFHKKSKIEYYLKTYEDYINKNFSSTKKSFDPFTNDSIGIVILKDRYFDGFYALNVFDESKNKNRIIELDDHSRFIDPQFFNKYNASILHGGLNELIFNNTENYVLKNSMSQLKKILSKQKLNEFNSIVLLKEKISNIVYYYHKELNYSFSNKKYSVPRFSSIYPLDLNDMKNRINRFYAIDFYEKEYIDCQIKKGRMDKNCIEHDLIDWDIINENVRKAIDSNTQFEAPNTFGAYPPFVFLNQCIDELISRNIFIIEEHYLPTPDISISDVMAKRSKFNNLKCVHSKVTYEFTSEHMKSYIIQFIGMMEKAYIEIVESCFPLIKSDLKFYSSMPHHYTINYDPLEKSSLKYYYRTSTEDILKIDFHYKKLTREEFIDLKILSHRISSIERLFKSNSVNMVDGFNTNNVDSNLVLRTWVYEQLRSDFQDYSKNHGINSFISW